MADYIDALGGDLFAQVYGLWDGSEVNPLSLNHIGNLRSYISYLSDTTTRVTTPEPLTEQQRRSEQRRWQQALDRAASLPFFQFNAQRKEERERLWNADPETSWIPRIPIGGDFDKMVHEKIKKVWVDQGIWNNEWKEMAVGHWKHEEPLVLESGLGTDLKAESPPGLFDMAPKQPQQRPRRPKSDDEKRRIAERRVVLEREREASRPYHQFVYQISKERERIEHESRSAEGSNNADINTKAYENVKNTWVKRGIWKTKWGILPGMSWKHEEPIEQVIEDSLMPEIPPRNPQSPRGKAVKAPFKLSFIRPLLFEPTHLQESGIRDASQHDSSKISRATGKERLRPRPRPYIPEQVSASVPQASSEGNAAERQPPPVHVTLRRSERLRRPVSSVTEDPQETVFPNPSKRAARPKPELKAVKNTTARRSEKPQGVTKRLQAKTGRGKAKNK